MEIDTGIHDERTRMEPELQLIEPDPYYGEIGSTFDTEWRFRSKHEVEEWSYDQGYECVEDPFWMIAPTDLVKEIGMLFLREGTDHAREAKYEEIQECIDVIVDERLTNYVDGQMRLYAGYDVAENGDTLEEGEHGKWEHMRTHFEMGIRDKLCDCETYASI